MGNNVGNNVGNRTNIGNSIGSGNVINRPTNITNNNVTNITQNNVNRPVYGGGGRGGAYGGYGAYRGNPYATYHAGWVNGFWNGNYNRGWGWGGAALGLGLGVGIGAWGLGSLWNSWGYSSFANPYFMPATVVQQPAVVVQQPVVYDYSEPLDLNSAPPSQEVMSQAGATVDSARGAFQSGDYAQAQKLIEQAIRQTPNDPTLHQFRAMCLFAMGRYDEAAVPMYTALSAGPGWDWTTLAGLYPSVDVYTEQLRALENYCNATPQSASGRFLLASLYMTQGNNDAAANMLKQVVALQPKDTLSSQILASLTGTPPDEPAQAQGAPSQPAVAQAAAAAQPPDQQAAPAAQPAPSDSGAAEPPALPTGPVPANLLAAWSASPAKDVTITLVLDQSKGFSWKVSERGQSREFRGTATFDKDVLALAPPDQEPMVGSVTWKDGSHFQFKALGAPPSDAGLTFGK
jgi:tetratricopeptide (TPR) repeat protein